MSLSHQIATAIARGFDAIDDLVEDVTYVPPADLYDPASGEVSAPSDSTAVRQVLFVDYTRRELFDVSVQPSDVRALLPRASNETFAPAIQGQILRANGQVWTIVRITGDSAGAVYDMQLRQVGGPDL